LASAFAFQGESLCAVVNGSAGLVDSLSIGGRECVKSGAFALRVIRYMRDPWGFQYDDYQETLGVFKLTDAVQTARFRAVPRETLPPAHVIEDGPIRTVVEAIFTYNQSYAVVRYKLPNRGTSMETEVFLFNAEKDVKVKLDIPTTLGGDAQYFGGTQFGVTKLTADGAEVPSQGFSLLVDDANAVSVIHFGNYSSNVENGRISPTLLNSAAYAAHPLGERNVLPKDRYSPRMDIGERVFRFIVSASGRAERLGSIARESQAAHQEPMRLAFPPTGSGTVTSPFVGISDSSILL
jgi:alpha-mannosidase